MAARSTPSSGAPRPRARLLAYPGARALLACGVDPAALPYLEPKLAHRVVLVQGIKVFAANILKQTMLSLGGDAAVHRGVIAGAVEYSDCAIIGDLRHFRRLVEKLHQQPNMAAIAELIAEQAFAVRDALALRLGEREIRWETLPVIMGILNVTPDSFSDGGTHLDPERAMVHALDMLEQGAQIIDIGGESTRPGAPVVDDRTEIQRVVPVIEKVRVLTDAPISVDTRKAAVAKAALEAGASIVNDVSALGDPAMPEILRAHGATVVLMHMRGTPATMQQDTRYADVVGEVYAYLAERIEYGLSQGIEAGRIIVDPGLGFGKDRAGNLSLIKHIAEFRSLGTPVLLGHSRKSFIGQTLAAEVDQREEGTDGVTAWAVLQGVDIVRVHDVRHAARIRAMMHAIVEGV